MDNDNINEAIEETKIIDEPIEESTEEATVETVTE